MMEGHICDAAVLDDIDAIEARLANIGRGAQEACDQMAAIAAHPDYAKLCAIWDRWCSPDNAEYRAWMAKREAAAFNGRDRL